MEKEQVYSTGYACYDYFFLSSDECETCTEFEEETGKVLFQFVFKLFLNVVPRQFNETEIIVVFGNGLCKVALRRGQPSARSLRLRCRYCDKGLLSGIFGVLPGSSSLISSY